MDDHEPCSGAAQKGDDAKARGEEEVAAVYVQKREIAEGEAGTSEERNDIARQYATSRGESTTTRNICVAMPVLRAGLSGTGEVDPDFEHTFACGARPPGTVG